MPDQSQFHIDRTCPGLWTITFSNPPINFAKQAVDLGGDSLSAWRPRSDRQRRTKLVELLRLLAGHHSRLNKKQRSSPPQTRANRPRTAGPIASEQAFYTSS